jgi:hypothetical protein
MNGQRSVEERISLWLEEEAVGQLPDRVLDASFERTRGLRQRPGPSVWRSMVMSRPIPSLIAVGAAAILLIVGVSFLRPLVSPNGVGGTQPTPTPTATPVDVTPTQGYTPPPQPTPVPPPAPDTPFTSDRYGYGIEYPAGWTATPANGDWTLADDQNSALTGHSDHFIDNRLTGDLQTFMSAWSVPLDGMTGDQWIRAYCTPPQDDPSWCDAGAATFKPIQVDGHDGQFADTGLEMLAFIPVGDRMYAVAIWRPGNESFLRQVLATMTFDAPASASPSAS